MTYDRPILRDEPFDPKVKPGAHKAFLEDQDRIRAQRDRERRLEHNHRGIEKWSQEQGRLYREHVKQERDSFKLEGEEG